MIFTELYLYPHCQVSGKDYISYLYPMELSFSYSMYDNSRQPE